MEYLKLYDKNHRYVKTDTRENAHKEGCSFYHDCVHIMIISKDDKILLQKRSKIKKENPNLWDLSVTGHVTIEDDLMSACKRETFEEIGLSVNESDFDKLFTLRDDTKMEFVNVFLLNKKIEKNFDFRFQDDEVSEVGLFDKKQFKNLLFSENYSPYFKEYKNAIIECIEKIL